MGYLEKKSHICVAVKKIRKRLHCWRTAVHLKIFELLMAWTKDLTFNVKYNMVQCDKTELNNPKFALKGVQLCIEN